MREKKNSPLQRMSIQTKLLMTFMLTAVLMFVINLMLYSQINHSMRRLDEVYATNASLNELSECLEQTQDDVYEYLNTKSSDSLENYYRNTQTLRDMLEQLNAENVENDSKILEANIRNMADTYLRYSEETVQAKRGRNVEKYNTVYNAALQNYKYVQAAIYRLNDMRFRSNTDNYRLMMKSMKYMEIVCSGIVIAAAVCSLMLLLLMIRTITEPLRALAGSANEVAAGNFDIELPDTDNRDEVGVVQHAFVKMIESIRTYIRQTKESMEKEQKMMERELLMETHLKDAQLKYLQAQINPHFLFNSLNAGAQLAMMEDAEKTSIFIEKMAEFFRYNVRMNGGRASLEEELTAVDNYVYILNVRFAGDIHFEKMIDPCIENTELPSMILQPIVENAVNHGIRNVTWEGWIFLRVERRKDCVMISVRDNGEGMTQTRIAEVLSGKAGQGEKKDSTGIAVDNVINRLELFFGEKDLLTIESEGIGKGTEVRIRIPLGGGEQTGA